MNLFQISVAAAILASLVGVAQVDNFSKVVAIVSGVLGWVMTRWLTPIVR
jgi:hypothetical protein